MTKFKNYIPVTVRLISVRLTGKLDFLVLENFPHFQLGMSFIINSYQNGVINSWNSFVTSDGVGAISLLGTAPKEETVLKL